MDTNEDSSSMRLVMARKPYTITKQRERWSEEEHSRFLEALKLYGRAWQKIEEHIGTKTAVQIRSHAQKFFTKLEKEAVNKGVPIGQTHDIEIPPPRPKRKPSNPYPRKTSAGSASQGGAKEGKQSTSDSPLRQQTNILDLEKEPLLEISEDNGTLENTDEFQNHNSEVSNLPSRSLPNENTLDSAKSGNSCTFIEFVPSLINKDETCKSILTTGNCKEGHDNGNIKMLEFLSLKPPQEKMVDNCEISENMSSFCSDEVRARQKYPRHVPVHILDGSLGMSATNITYQESIHQTGGNPTSFAPEQQSHASTPSVQQPFCNFLPILPPIPSQDAYAHASSTFSSLIISALLQNPAAHAAATFAATVSMGEGFPSQHIRETTPSPAAIAGATVAAATAWWAVNGLLPSFSPMVTTQARAVKSDERETIHNADLPECSEALQEHHSVSKSPSDSTSNYEEHEDAKQNAGMSSHGVEEIETVTQLNDLTNFKSKKQVDRSSCGSNTSSSSDVETDALLKHDKGDEEPQGYDINQQSNDRRGRMFSNINDSWKEVSEEGRVAFQALFSRDVLPQSFYMQPASNDEVQRQSDDQHMIHNGSNSRLVDYVPPLINENNKQQGLPRLGVEHENLKARRTGFKPYKRCSVEAKDSRDGEKSPKRIRVEGGEAAAST